MKILSFGEILWDIYSDSKHIGGAPFNFSAHFQKCGGKAYLNSAVGDDELGTKTLSEVSSLGIFTDFISKNEKETGKCLVMLDENSVPSYNLLDDTAYDYIKVPNIKNHTFDALYFGTLALRNQNNRETLKEIIKDGSFREIFVDINIRKPYISPESALFALGEATIVKISDEELPTLKSLIGLEGSSLEQAAKKLSERFDKLKLILITLGGDGAFTFETKTEIVTKCDAQKVKLVSTVGAGDSFSAAFISKYLNGEEILNCLNFASKVSGFVVSKKEAVPDYNPNLL